MKYDLVVIGSGPGGYTAAIKASQLGMKTAIVECAEIGGVCLNRGCISTKTLLKYAQVFDTMTHCYDYGICAGDMYLDAEKIVGRSRAVTATMRKGIDFLLKKNKIEVIHGFGTITSPNTVAVSGEEQREISASHIIIATGARPKDNPSFPIDEQNVWSYKKGLFPEYILKTVLIAGSGATGVELAMFYKGLNAEVTIVETLPAIVPREEPEISEQLRRSLQKAGIRVLTNSRINSVKVDDYCFAEVSTPQGSETIKCDQVLSVTGVVANIENIGLETVGVEVENGKIKTDPYYRTNVPGIYAIGDVIDTPALAHVASAEAITCVEKIAGLEPDALDYGVIPTCIYTTPEIASVGLSEKAAKEAGYSLRIGKFPFTASGKAAAMGNKDGFVKLIFDQKTDKLLGSHLIGPNVTEVISELALVQKMGITGKQLMKTVHPHPTISEAIVEAAAAAHNEAIHL
ncbi:MAG: dihydrolipoyl dehydrogenase [Prevotellaceae bacterium]|jgi:dihydrolipoamide dehydrogenase|nr:dihydrolipoyl dehydrogenase [Prevotellaceae bacterium]